jgi:hypothetical protein
LKIFPPQRKTVPLRMAGSVQLTEFEWDEWGDWALALESWFERRL